MIQRLPNSLVVVVITPFSIYGYAIYRIRGQYTDGY